MSFEGLHETVIRDVIDVIKDGLNQAEDMGFSVRSGNSLAKSSSLSKATEGLVLIFPTLCTITVSVETASMITKAVERKAISLLQIAFSAFNITNSADAVSFVKQFHSNIGSGKMSIDKFMDAMNSVPTSESSSMINGVDRVLLKAVLEDFKKMECYFEDDISESSINDYKVINRYGKSIIVEDSLEKKRPPAAGTFDDVPQYKSTEETDEERKDEQERRARAKEKRDISNFDLDRDKFKHQKAKDTAGMGKDMTGMVKDMNDILKTQILPSDIKKANEMVPSMMIINFMTISDKMQTPITNQAIIGIKAKLYPVSSNDVINKILVKNADNNVFLKMMRVSTKELNFVKDFLFAIDDAKLAAISGSVKGSETYKLLKVLERRALKGKVRRKLNMNNAYKAISTLVISREEADYIKNYNNIDVSKPEIIRKLMESLNLMMFIIADDSEEAISLIMDTGEDMYETLSYTNLDREAADGSYKKAINLMTKVTR